MTTENNIYRFFLIEKKSLDNDMLDQVFNFIQTQYDSFGQTIPFRKKEELMFLSDNIDGDVWFLSIFNRKNYLDSRVIITNEEGAKFYFQH